MDNLHAELTADASNFQAGFGQATDQLRRFEGAANRAAGVYVDAQGRMRSANGRFVSSANEAGRAADRNFGGAMSGKLLKYAAGYLSISTAINQLRQGLSVVSDMQRMAAGLEAVSEGQTDLTRMTGLLTGVSDKYALSLDALADSYKSLKAAANGTTLEGAATEKIFIAVSKSAAALKLSTEQTQGTLQALQQMMSKGTVQAEELRGQLSERLPGAFNLAAKAMGVSTRELGKMLESGEVLAADLLPKLADELEKTYGSKAQGNVSTMAGGYQRMTDQFKLFLAEFAHSEDVDGFFTRLGNSIANTLRGMREMTRAGQGFIRSGLNGLLNTDEGAAAEEAGALRSEFPTMPKDQQLARLQMLREEMEKLEKRNTEGTLYKDPLQLQRYIYLKPLLKDLTKLYTDLRRAERRETPNADNNAITGYEALKKQFDAVQKKKQDLLAENKAVPDALEKEFQTLKARINAIDEATSKTNKKKTEKSVSEQLSAVEDQIDKWKQNHPGVEIPFDLRWKKGALMDTLDKRDVDLDKIDLPRRSEGDIEGGFMADPDRQRPADQLEPIKRYADRLKNGYNYLVEKGAEITAKVAQTRTTLQEALQEFKDTVALAGADGTNPLGLMNNLKAPELQKAFENGLVPTSLIDRIKQQYKELAETIKVGWEDVRTSATEAALMGIGGAIAGQKGALSNALQSVANMLAGYLAKVGAMMVKMGALQALSGNPLLVGLGVKSMAAGAALVAGAGVIRGMGAQIPAFANEGGARGSTLAMIGDNWDAKVNPEYVLKRNTIQNIVRNAGGGGRTYIPEMRIGFDAIYIAWREGQKQFNDWNG